jgi:beta-lactamase class A
MKTEIEALVKDSGAEVVAFALHDFENGRELLLQPDVRMHPASTMKAPVMMEVFRQAKEGSLSLDDRLPVKNEFISIADGSLFSVGAEDDSEPTLYKKIGRTESIRELNRLMITMSSNFATNLLVQRVTAAKINDFMHRLGAPGIEVLRGVEDGKAYAKGMNNVATARGLMRILQLLEERRVVSKTADQEMIEVLLAQKHNEGIPTGVSAEVKVAHKTGWNDRLYHDAAILYPPGRKPYVLVVMTRGIEDEKRSFKLVGDISRVVYSHLL